MYYGDKYEEYIRIFIFIFISIKVLLHPTCNFTLQSNKILQVCYKAIIDRSVYVKIRIFKE